MFSMEDTAKVTCKPAPQRNEKCSEKITDPKNIKDDQAEDERKVGFKEKIFRRLLETQMNREDHLELTRILLVRKLIQ